MFVGYFENTVAGKFTEPWVAVFRATFIIYRGRVAQSVYRQIKMKIDPFTNVYHTWNVITSDQIAHLGKIIESTTHDSWWSIFEGWSPQARHLLNIFIHPIIILLILFILLTMFNIYIFCYY